MLGCEYATIFANFGKTKVYLIDKADRILPFEDEDIAALCSRNMEAKGESMDLRSKLLGVHIHHGVKLENMKVVNGKVKYSVICTANGEKEEIIVDSALLAIGREPVLTDLGLEKAGVKVTKGLLGN